MTTPARRAWLQFAALTILVWFGPSVLVLQRVHSWAEFKTLAWVLPMFPGVVAWDMGGALFGRLPSGGALALGGALVMVGFVVGTFALARRCQRGSSEWLSLIAAFILSCLLWWGASALVAA